MQMVVFKKLGSTDFQITKVETDIGKTQVKTLENKKHYQVSLTLPPGLPVGILKGKVRVHTNHPKSPLIQVPFFAVVK